MLVVGLLRVGLLPVAPLGAQRVVPSVLLEGTAGTFLVANEEPVEEQFPLLSDRVWHRARPLDRVHQRPPQLLLGQPKVEQ